MSVRYTHGFEPAVLKSQNWRTIDNSAAYLSPKLRATSRVLDVGCGPGTITADFARVCDQGVVIGIDNAQEIVDKARGRFPEATHANLTFRTGTVHALPFPDGSFDVVHAHQVLKHCGNPVAALREMKRVCAKGGVVAARDFESSGFVWSPPDPRMDSITEAYEKVVLRNGGETCCGRNLLVYARAAGFNDVTATASTWNFSSKQDRDWWGSLWAERIEGALGVQLREVGATEEELVGMATACREWAACETGWFVVTHGEILCVVE